MFSQTFLDELIARNDIVDVVGSYVALTPKGGSYWGCCPFHNEKTPSFHVLQDKQFYHCFGGKKGGGVINCIMEIENLSYSDAVRFLAKRVNMEVPEDRASADANRLRKRLLALNRDAARWYYDVLQSSDGAAVRAYLDKRAIQRKIAVRFGMGASPDSWDALLRAMTAKGYTKQELLTAGLIVANKNGLTAFKAKVYVDATGDGDLAAWAGADTLKTDVLQSSTLCFSLANVDTYAFRYDSPNLQSDDPNTPINKGIADGRYPKSMGHICLNLVGPDVVQFNAGHIDTDATDPWKLSLAMQEGRQLAEQFLKAFQEVSPKAFGNAFLVKTASLLGVRDSRRVVGDYLFTGDDWRARRQFDDEIGRNCYYIDIHKSGAVPVFYKKGESHGIPYRCLTPKGLKNVLVAGRCISTDEEAFGSLRVMPPCLVTGEAAGMAAYHAIQQGHCDVHKVDTQHLRARLKEEGQYSL